jgi:hypothetical protein
MDRDRALAILRQNEAALRAAGIVRLSLFGSTARNQAGPESDVDLLAGYDEARRISLLDIAGMEIQLSQMLGCKVDLVEEGTLKPHVRARSDGEFLRAF